MSVDISWLHKVVADWISRKMLEKRELFWITINPKPGVALQQFRELVMTRLMNRKIMKGAVFCFEQRAEEQPYHGFHCHILLDKTMSPKQMHDRIYNTFKNIVGNPKHIDLRVYPYTYREEKLEYLKGRKWDSEKETLIKATQEWRKQEGLDDMYEA